MKMKKPDIFLGITMGMLVLAAVLCVAILLAQKAGKKTPVDNTVAATQPASETKDPGNTTKPTDPNNPNPSNPGGESVALPLTGDKINTSGAHPNSRFTSLAKNCPCISSEFDSLKGVPVSAIIFGGRRAKTAPLVYQSTSWQNGTFVGSIMASETTAAAAGAIGVVRRDPMAMRPFVGYNMGDYWAHWLEMGTKIPHAPKIFHVNWFRTDENGNFIWPGFGENLRVVLWILARCAGEVDADITPIGYVPKAEDINIEGLDGITLDTIRELLSIDTESWLADVENIKEFYNLVGDRVPDALWDELAALEARLSK